MRKEHAYKGLWVLWSFLALLAFLLAAAFQQLGGSLASFRHDIIQEKQAQLEQLQAQEQQLLQENEQLKAAQEALWDSFLEEQDDPALLEKLKRLQLWAAAIPVEGAGLSLSINDKAHYDPVQDPSCALVHDLHIRRILQELIQAGAKAIAINGERIVANSAVRCAGSTILINQERITPPYVFQAIGDPEALLAQLEGSEFLKVLVEAPSSLQLHWKKERQLKLPGFDAGKNMARHISQLERWSPND